MSKKNSIIIGITGSIAAYKSCDVIRGLKKKSIDVYPIMTKNATKFITPLTIKTLADNPVYIDMFEENYKYSMPHISLSKICDTMLIAPATANIIGKIANGIADDLLSTIALSFDGTIFIAPAMNTKMYNNQFVQENINKIKKHKKIKIIEPDSGELACGDSGEGRLADVDKIVDVVLKDVLSKG